MLASGRVIYLFQASFEVKFETKDDLLSFFALLSGVVGQILCIFQPLTAVTAALRPRSNAGKVHSLRGS